MLYSSQLILLFASVYSSFHLTQPVNDNREHMPSVKQWAVNIKLVPRTKGAGAFNKNEMLVDFRLQYKEIP